MRTILFRGKRKDNGKWVEGFLIIRKIWSATIYIIRVEDNGFDNYEEYEVIPETVGQYTGLTDKNGKKIFEGDIFKVSDETVIEYRFVAKYGKCGCVDNCTEYGYNGFYFEPHDYGLRNDPIYWLSNCKCEVIGNIHDNPDLLKDGEQ